MGEKIYNNGKRFELKEKLAFSKRRKKKATDYVYRYMMRKRRE